MHDIHVDLITLPFILQNHIALKSLKSKVNLQELVVLVAWILRASSKYNHQPPSSKYLSGNSYIEPL